MKPDGKTDSAISETGWLGPARRLLVGSSFADARVGFARLGVVLLFMACLAWQDAREWRGQASLLWSVGVTAVLTALVLAVCVGLRHSRAGEGTQAPSAGWKRRTWDIVAVVVVTCLLAETLHDLSKLYWRHPVAAYSADMLPLVRNALRDFWRDGISPYRWHHIGNWQIPMTFHPGLWLAYTPAWALKIDVRYVGAFAEAAVSLLILTEAWRNRGRLRGFWPLLALTALAAFFVYHVRPMQDFQRMLHTSPYWLALVLWALATRHRLWRTSALLLAWACLARSPVVVVVPFWFLHLWRVRREAPVVQMLLLYAVGLFVLGFGFFCASPRLFLYPVTGWYERMAGYLLQNEPHRILVIGWTALVERMGLYRSKLAIAAAAMLVLLGEAALRQRSASDLLARAGAAMLVFLMFTPLPFYYVYFPPLFVLTLSAWPDPRRKAAEDPDSRKAVFALVAPLVIVAALTTGVACRHVRDLGGFATDGAISAVRHRDRTARLWQGAWGSVRTGSISYRRFASTECSVALPVRDITFQRLEVRLAAVEPEGLRVPLLLVVSINEELAGHSLVTRDSLNATHVFDVPRGNLHRGLNDIHFSLRRDLGETGLMSLEPRPLSGLYGIQAIQLADPRWLDEERDYD